MSALPGLSVAPVGVSSCLPERKFSLHFARFGAVCMHCVPATNTGGSGANSASSMTKSLPEPRNSFDKLRMRKPLPSSSKFKGGHRRSLSASSQGMLSSKGCAVLSAFENFSISDAGDECFAHPFRRLVSTEIPPTPVLGPTIVCKDPPAFSDLDCDTTTPSSECMSPPPMDL